MYVFSLGWTWGVAEGVKGEEARENQLTAAAVVVNCCWLGTRDSEQVKYIYLYCAASEVTTKMSYWRHTHKRMTKSGFCAGLLLAEWEQHGSQNVSTAH